MKLRGTLLVALLALGGCSGFEPDMTSIEEGIAADLGMDVDCPDSIEWRVGDEFRCIAEGGGERVQVVVHMENDEGEYSWETN